MKRSLQLFPGILISLVAFSSYAQTAITLDHTNITGQVKGTIHTHTASVTGVSAPNTGADQTWDYTNLTGGTDVSTNLLADTAFSSTAVIDTSSHENVVQTSPIKSDIVYDIDSKGYFITGRTIPHQDYSDAIITQNPKDSTLWDLQTYKGREDIIAFPATFGSSWQSKTVHPLISKINLLSYGIKGALVSINVHTVTKDSVIGWGTLQIPAGSKKSLVYNVLLIRHALVATDSFYLNGQLAPSFMLQAFHSKQNDTSTIDYSESFYRAGTGSPLLTLDFGYDSTYTNPTTISYDEDNVYSGFETSANQTVSFDLFPNPSKAGMVNTQVMKSTAAAWHIAVADELGRNIKNETINGHGNINFEIDMTGFKSGLYFVKLTDENGNALGTSKLNITP